MAETDRPQKTIWRVRIACWIPKPTVSLTIWTIHCFSVTTMVVRKSLNITLHYIFCLFIFAFLLSAVFSFSCHRFSFINFFSVWFLCPLSIGREKNINTSAHLVFKRQKFLYFWSSNYALKGGAFVKKMWLWSGGETRESSTGLNYPIITRKETLISVSRTMQFPVISLRENEFKPLVYEM